MKNFLSIAFILAITPSAFACTEDQFMEKIRAYSETVKTEQCQKQGGVAEFLTTSRLFIIPAYMDSAFRKFSIKCNNGDVLLGLLSQKGEKCDIDFAMLDQAIKL